jgi:hypothetical protein
VDAQCKFKKIKKYYHKSIKSEDCNIKPDISTKIKKILDKPFEVVSITSMVKSGKDYYLYFFIARNSSSKFEIHKNNSLVLMIENGEPVTVFPCGDFRPRAMPLLDCNIGCLYSINIEQLKQIANSDRVLSIILHVSADKEIPSAQIDEDGSQFFEYEIKSKGFSDNLTNAAACILTK